tara:strand:- start:8492 stop:11482 length:2991 start_codon:yes stop_codon:yes gene_type:complete
MKTYVGNLAGTDIDKGDEWNLETALGFFYQFIIPVGRKELGTAKGIRSGLVRWVNSSRRWANDRDIGVGTDAFNLDVFNQINRKALDTLLSTTLGDLNQNRYFEGADNPEPKSFTTGQVEITNKDGSKTIEDLGYGVNFGKNESGLLIADQDKYNLLRNDIIDAKVKLEEKQILMANAKGKSKTAFRTQVVKCSRALQLLESQLEDYKKPSYDDNITLREVINNDPKTEKFYSVMSFEPETREQKIALGILRELVITEESKEKYEELYGEDSGLSYEEWAKDVEAREAEYIKILALPFIVKQSMTGLTKNNKEIEIKVDMNELFEKELGGGKKEAGTKLTDLADNIMYPIKLPDGTELTDKSKFIQHMEKADSDTAYKLIKRVVKMWSDQVLEPLLNIRTEITVVKSREDIKPKDTDIAPVRMSKETLQEFVIPDMVKLENVKLPKKTDKLGTTKTKFKLPIEFKNIPLDFESGYARTIGASSKSVISQEKVLNKKINASGTIRVKTSRPVPANLINSLPGISADIQWRYIKDTMLNYYRAEKQSVETRLANKVNKTVTRGMLSSLEQITEFIGELKTIQKEDTDDDLFDLSKFSQNYWLKGNGNFKFSLSEFRNKLISDNETTSGNLTSNILRLNAIITTILDYVEENESEINDYIDFIESDDSEEEAQERIAEQFQSTQRAQRQAEAREESERERDEDSSEGEEALARILSGEVDIDEYEDEETGLKFSTLNNMKIFNVLKDIQDKRREFDKINDSMVTLRRDIKNIQDTKGKNINSEDFKKVLNEWFEIVDYPNNDPSTFSDIKRITKLIDSIDESLEPEAQASTKAAVKKQRNFMQEYWDEWKQRKEFQVPKLEDFTKIVRAMNLSDSLSSELVNELAFNDARLGMVSASSNKLFIEIDYSNKRLILTGKIKWVSERESYIGYGIRDTNIEPKVTASLGMTPTQKKLSGKRLSGKGRIQGEGLRGENTDTLRLDFLTDVKNRTSALIGALRV